MDPDLPFDHPLLEGLPRCDPNLVLALIPVREDSGADSIAALVAKVRAEAVEGVKVECLSPLVAYITIKFMWARGELMVVAGRRAVRLSRQGWSAASPGALADEARVAATRAGCAIGLVFSLVLAWLLLSAWSDDGAPEGRVRVATLIIPFLIPPLIGAAIGTVIGVRVGRSRAERARHGARTLEQDVAARDALVGRVIAIVKGLATP